MWCTMEIYIFWMAGGFEGGCHAHALGLLTPQYVCTFITCSRNIFVCFSHVWLCWIMWLIKSWDMLDTEVIFDRILLVRLYWGFVYVCTKLIRMIFGRNYTYCSIYYWCLTQWTHGLNGVFTLWYIVKLKATFTTGILLYVWYGVL